MKQDNNEYENGEKNDYEEPSLEDFLLEETDIYRSNKRPVFIKIITLLIAFSLLSGVFGVWIKMFNLPSFEFLERSSELSQEDMIKVYKEAVVSIEGNGFKGTGFNVSVNGRIITNFHVIESMDDIVISFPNGDFYKGSVVLSEKEIDFAIVEIDTTNELPFLPLSPLNSWEIGDRVYIIGNPLAYTRIAIDGTIVNQDLNGSIKIQAPIHKGNSGSPVINEEGQVIGVVYAKTIPKVGKEDTLQGFATPIELFSHYISP
jgi:serine protease Do